MERAMKRKLDLDKVEAALKKAGQDALNGPKELRSGRFVARDSTSGEFVPATKKRKVNSSSTKP
jgi:hypothetical protein